MPQLNQPYSYLGEYAQLSLLFLALLILVCVYVTPAMLTARACAITLSASKSPLEQFSVPIFPLTGATSLESSIVSAVGLNNMVGVYGVLTLVALVPWFVGVQAEALQVQRPWGGVVLGAIIDTVRSIVGNASNVLG